MVWRSGIPSAIYLQFVTVLKKDDKTVNLHPKREQCPSVCPNFYTPQLQRPDTSFCLDQTHLICVLSHAKYYLFFNNLKFYDSLNKLACFMSSFLVPYFNIANFWKTHLLYKLSGSIDIYLLSISITAYCLHAKLAYVT